MTDIVLVQVAESAKVLLDADQEVPPDLMAKVLKSLLLLIKGLDQQRRETEQASVLDSRYDSDCRPGHPGVIPV